MKCCSKCHIGKPLDDFHKDKSKKDGLCSTCKGCTSLWHKAYHQENKERICRKVSEYNSTHKEQKKEYDAKHRRENRNRIQGVVKLYRKKNPDKVKQWDASHRKKNADKINEHRKIFRENNREKLKLQQKMHYAQHKDRFRIRQHNRDAKKRTSNSDKITLDVVNMIMYQQDSKCYYCKKELEKYHIEHLVPLISGGRHKEYNIALSCPTCNLSKGVKMPDVFLSQQQRNNNARSN